MAAESGVSPSAADDFMPLRHSRLAQRRHMPGLLRHQSSLELPLTLSTAQQMPGQLLRQHLRVQTLRSQRLDRREGNRGSMHSSVRRCCRVLC